MCPAFFRTNLHESLQGKDEEFEKSGTRMITTAKTSADAIAARVVKGVEAGRHVILTDRMGRTAFWSKRLARPVYERAAMSAAHRIAARSRRTAR